MMDMDIIDLVDFIDTLEDSDEELTRCYLVDLDDPFKRYDDTEFQSRFRFTKAAVHQLFDVIRSDSELQQRKQAVPGL